MKSIGKSSIELKLIDHVEKWIGPQGFRTVDVDCHLANRSVIRVFIERLGEGESVAQSKTSVEDCAQVSRILSPALEVEQLIPGDFELEVSTPGLDRRLRMAGDFEPYVGHEVKLRLNERMEGLGARVRATIVGIPNGDLVVNVSGREESIPLTSIRRANLVWGE